MILMQKNRKSELATENELLCGNEYAVYDIHLCTAGDLLYSKPKMPRHTNQ